jgi:hypothetical protein
MALSSGSVQIVNPQASHCLYDILQNTAQKFPSDFVDSQLPETAQAFRQNYIHSLPRFEAARLASPASTLIARDLALGFENQLVYRTASGDESIHSYLSTSSNPLALTTIEGESTSLWQPAFEDKGVIYQDLAKLGAVLANRNVITPSAADALSWLQQHLAGEGVSLTGRKIAVIGAAAEMAPTAQLLKTGAQVLWLDRVAPSAALCAPANIHGSLSYHPHGVDLLAQPKETLATLIAFANGEPLDLCLYAYAPGQGREIRLTGIMDALVNSLPPQLISSVTLLVSPTTPTRLAEVDIAAMDKRLNTRPAWESALAAIGLLGTKGGKTTVNSTSVTNTIVSIQGASYQAAQYLAKIIMADCWAKHGNPYDEQTQLTPMRVSANTAAITQTQSLDHPVFDAAFGGAAALQVETFTPNQSQLMNGLLAIHDWLRPELPVPGQIRVHGGIHTLPYPLEIALRPAAAIGFARRPKLLAGLLR